MMTWETVKAKIDDYQNTASAISDSIVKASASEHTKIESSLSKMNNLLSRILSCPKCSSTMKFVKTTKCLQCTKCPYKAEDFVVHMDSKGDVQAVGFIDEVI